MNPIVAAWLPGELATDPAQRNNSGATPEFILFYYAERHIIPPTLILFDVPQNAPKKHVIGGNRALQN
jgi:hypothetical protein